MDMIPLKATARKQGSASVLRHGGAVPCVLYGNEVKNASLQCALLELTKTYSKAGESTLVALDIDGKQVPVLFHDLQFDPVSGRITHVDFLAVDMKKEIEAPVPLRFTGEAPAAKEFSAVIVTVLNHVTVRCLPVALPHEIIVPLDALTQLHAVIKVADLAIPVGVKVKDNPESVLVIAQEQRKEEEIAPPAPAAEGAAEGAVAPAEGAPAAEGAAAAAPAAEAPSKKKGKEE